MQEAVHRIQPYEMTRDLIAQARALGFHSINVDLIYGLPSKPPTTSHAASIKPSTLDPDRVALFSYAHVPWLRKQQGAFATHLPEGLEKFRIFRTGLEKFLGAGYQFIGMDHFAQARRRACRRPAQSHAAPQFSGLHHQGRRRPLRHGRQRHQRPRAPTRKTIASSRATPKRSNAAASPPCAATA